MTNMIDYFKNAELSVASYATLQVGMGGGAYVTALTSVGMSLIQAREFAGVDANNEFIPGKGYEIVGQMPNTSSGFSATVFRKNGSHVLAIRGTEGFSFSSITDWVSNVANIGPNGIAIMQAIDLFNYFQDLKAQQGSTVYHYAYNQLTNQVTYTSAIASSTGALYGQAFTVTGHSLGGHLALIMTRLAPSLVGGLAYTYNAPGFDPLAFPVPGSEGFFTLLHDAEVSARGSSEIRVGSWDGTNFYNLVVPEDIVHLIGYVPGAQLTQFSESGAVGSPISSHDKNALSDALAVYSLLSRIDPLKTDTQVLSMGSNIFKAAASTAGATLEGVVNAIGDLFGSGTKIDIGNRDQLYQRLIELDATLIDAGSGTLKPQYQGLSLIDLTGISASALETSASTDIGYRYALRALNPFAILGNNALYTPHNPNGELDLYNVADRSGTLTTDWITDRARLLYAELLRNTQDNPDLARLPDPGDRVTEYHHYRNDREEVFFAQKTMGSIYVGVA